uniref:Dynein cytoplasmic 1 heavy chain 1 n=1 Tax=Tetraodon nigroviridis TaxID=99883 RepID=H3C202_TETNG
MSDGGGTEESSGTMEVSTVQTVADTSVLQKHIRKLVPLLLEDGGEAPASLETALEEKSAVEQMKKFLADPQIHTILVERSALKEEVGDEGEEEKECITYNISIDIHYGLKSNSLALIKRTGVIDADKPISTQVRVLTLSEDSPYETLHSFISNAVAPFFKSYIRESGKADRDGDKMAPSVEKKIAELEMGLLHLQQNIEIPEISLLIHPNIANIAKQCYERGEKPKVTDFGDKVEDPTFLNQLQSGVNRWIREIQKVTKLDRDPASGTALQEISFWLNLERALNRIQEKRESPEVLLTLDILKHGKRFHATVSFDTDTGLKQAVETVNDYNPLMKDFPLNDLLSALELDKIRQALMAIFTHLKKIRNTKYPIQRALRLVEAISRDLSSQLLKVLGTRKLMHVAYEEFEKVMVACFEVFQTWEDEYEKLQVLLRDIVKRKREENLKMVWRLSPAHRKLQSRLDHMRRFRRQHEQLRAVIVRVLRPQVSAVPQHAPGETVEPQDLKVATVLFDAADANAIEEVNLAYENVKEVDGLDVSKEGVEAWEAAMKRYDERIDRVETRITARLRDQLGTAKNANEMFRIFSRFNALFVRPHIRGAIREYQTQLIQRVKDDIESLHDKFKVQYPQSQACKMSHVRDLPPVSGSIIWAKQIDRQLTAYMKRVEDVLGKGWENHVEGLKLKQDGDSFRAKLNTQEIFDDWARKVQQRNLGVSGRIFTIESTRARGRSGNMLKLKVNFLPEIITLSKEVRNLKWLSFRVPLAIVNKAHQANQLYPFAISLIESVRTYERTCEKVEERSSISLLVAGLKKEVQALVTEGITLVWESYKLDPYVQRLAETVFNFQEKVDDLLLIEEKIDLEVRSLETCMFDHKTFSDILSRVQKAVDDLNLYSYSNLPIWVNKLDIEIERILGVRLQAGLKAWTQVLRGQVEDKADVDMDTEAPQVSHKPGGEPKIKNVVHELRITNQVIYLNPPIEDCRYKLYQEMFSWKMVILSLPRIQSQRYQVGVHYELSEEEKFYRNALTRMPDGPAALEEAYNAVEDIVGEVEQYVKVWLQYQCLWDMQAENIYNRLGEDLTKWQALLVQIRKARGTFDNAETRKEFGPVVIDYGKVQSKVNLKYDSWHKEVLSKFGQMLGQNMQDFHAQISKSRQELEQHSVDTASTSDAVNFITYVQTLKRKIKQFEKNVDVIRNGQRLLEKQRFQFPPSWLYIDNIEGEWGAFSDIMKRKDTAIQQQVANLQMKIVQEDKAVENRTTDLLNDWEKTKPVAGNLRPEEALQSLTIYEGNFSRLKDEREKCARAKEALELTDTGVFSGSEERVQVALEELHDLKEVWSELSKVWEQIDQMKEQPWVSVQPRKLRQSLDALLNQLKNFQARLRQYASYEYVQRLLKGYLKVSDIKHLLPVETQRFQSISTEFLALMKKVSKSPLVMDVLNIQGVQRSLERLADLLGKIQKALGEYLERERSSFPRFYFVGDEDLLEIIGNSKNVAKLQKHFKKMFAGVSSILLNEDNTEVLGISSREGEEILYKTPVSITEHPKINEWLTLVEKEMRVTLAKLLAESVTEVTSFNKGTAVDLSQYITWIDRYQAQLVVLSTQIAWSENIESALTTISGGGDMTLMQAVLSNVEATLNVLADTVLMEQPPLRRRKLEHLITELVHQRDVTRTLIKNKIDNPKSFEWLSQMRFYFDPKQTDVLQQLSIQMANAKFNYGFEYLGVQDKLVQTPLTDRCYLTMTQALEARLGGSPFGPAGTGKTESVKALGHQLGRFVLVFNCDETFDFQAMGRIFVGLCQVGAWGCFDEFNRLEERMLSAVSQQVQYIQVALREHSNPNRDRSVPVTTELLNKMKVSPDMAIFITMNPGAGRSNLPDNLKKLFRSLAMTKPDRQLIAQVMLYSQGFRTAEVLAKKIVPFFKLCDEQLSSQSHYDFGLRALKSVLISAGNVKRERIQRIKKDKLERGEDVDENEIAENLPEQEILIQSVCETMVPKLVAEDIPLLFSLLSDVFPGIQYQRGEMTALREELKKVCGEMYLTYGDGDEVGSMWVEKVLQLYQITQINHGLMMVGPSGSGKTMAWRVLLKALERLEGVEGVAHIIDPKAISKDHLYGTLDPNTREWTDGLFTTFSESEMKIALKKKKDIFNFISQMLNMLTKFHKNTIKTSRNGGKETATHRKFRTPLKGCPDVLFRFLRHVPVVYVDYPGPASLTQIYGTFNRAMLRLIPSLRTYAEPLTAAMVEFYTMSQERFTQDTQPHYIYSPREMTRWVRGIFEALRPLETLPVEGLIRIWAHEALRLFQDRLVGDDERRWTDENIDMVALKHFPNIDKDKALNRPILYSNWLSKDYIPVEQEELRDYVKARLKVFYEEELDVPLVLFNEVLDHVLRIDRIFRQPQGHLLLIGVSGAGKTTLSRFVAWMNGLSVYQIKVHRKYTGEDFDEDLRTVLRRSGCKNEKIAFIMDESNVLDSGFLERMNTLLANGEVPGLFEGDEYATLMTQCKEGAQKEGLMLDTHEELYKWFTSQVIRNLHVVFTMNPSSEGLKDRAATSPALFNRCVLNWFGDWSTEALYQVGKEFTSKMDLEKPNYKVPDYMPIVYDKLPQPPSHREAIVNGCVFVHQTLHQANNRLAKRGGHTMAITPRHYLDFINQYANLFNEKRSELEEQQMHLNVGLRKIKETVDQTKKVEELRRDLRIKSQELEAKNAAANDKLKKMVKDQQEAEKKKVVSQEIQEAVYKQQEVIKDKQQSVKHDLDQVEPAVIEAQNAVSSIKRQHLVEVRTMTNPPAVVKLALESICLMLGEETSDWKKIRQVIIRDNFISSIVGFSSEEMSDSIREKMKKNYLSNPGYNYDQINRASLACGPMVKWAIAQLNYADMLKRVEPLRNELQKLEDDATDNKTKAEEVEQMIRDLEASIARYKEEYAVLISEAQAIKADLAAVEAKVNRSTALLKSLSAERDRWEKTSETFKNQMSTIAGDCLLSAAFITYAGYFEQQMRQNLFTTWSHHLQQANIQFRTDIARTEYLSNADERLRWQANSLPADDLCTENAIMLKRFNRYPLIIDPSGQATEFIMNEYKDRKITRTSFLDDAFRKNLESALRFGNPLLVQDVESYDPILNPVLNREVRRTGGRVLITLGDQDIDLSPSFVIFLSTRDPTVEFPPDLCSRVTFVNFTVTRSSLQSQCLNEVLKAERPDVDEKRSDLLKLQGEFQLRLRQLEKSLLQALNEVKGRILDDDTIITTLENLKKEAAEVTRKVEETDIVMAEVETVSQQYLTLSSACSSIYFTMEALNQMHFLYQYSLHFFLDTYHTVLYENPNLKSISDHSQRLAVLTKDLFQVVFNRAARGMLHLDHITFAMLLAKISLKGMTSEPSYDSEFQHFLRGKEIVLTGTSLPKVKGLSSEQSEAMVRLSRLPAFSDLVNKVQADEQFFMWIESNTPELAVPYLWSEEKQSTPIGQAVHQLLLIQAFRPDRLLAMSHIFVAKVLGESFMSIIEQPLDLANVVENEVKPSTPVLMCSVPGYDASGLVRDLAAEENRQITSISIGSAEGFNKADKDINTAVKSGRWVMLENVHLAPAWLMHLEKKLHSMHPHACFRLFLTMEINPKVPVNLLRAGRIFVFEPTPGVKANMLRTFSSIPVARMCKAPNERARLYFLLAWFHAVIQERLRYAPLGWSKKYEFGESDLRSACDTVDTWLDDTAKGRQNIAPDKIPWAALKTLMAQSIYGGRIDNDFDQRLLNTFLDRIFTKGSFDSEFKLALKVDGHKDLKMPDGIRREEFMHWVEMLPDTQTPSWLGLPSNAEKVLLTTQGTDMMGKMLKMQMLEDEDDLAYETEKKERTSSTSDTQPAWMRTLHTTACNWLQLMPQSVNPLKRTVENIKDPLFRFFEREVKMGGKMLQDVRQDLSDVVQVCQGKKKQTNYLRTLISDLVKGILPRSWCRYTVPASMTVIQWVADFSERIKQLQMISQGAATGGAKELKNIHVCVGSLFVPEAYITATRQYVAQANSWSLEELCLEVNVTTAQGASLDACSFGIKGLKLQGATCANNKLSLSTTISTELPLTQLRWIKHSSTEKRHTVTLPVYLNFTRSDLIFTVDFDIATKEDPHSFYERGVAVLCNE